MFRNTNPDTEPAPVEVPRADPVPLSHLSLDVDEPVGGWVAYLSGRGIEVVTDDVGRLSVSRSDVRQLFDEKREAESRARELAARTEQQFIEQDRQWRAQLSPGTPWWEFDGANPAEVWAAAEKAARPRRRTLLEDALEGTASLEYHPLGGEES